MLQCEINNFWLISTKSRSPQCRNTHSSQLIRGALKTYLRKPAETCCQSARQLIYCRGSYLFEGQCWSVLEWHHFLLWAVGSKKRKHVPMIHYTWKINKKNNPTSYSISNPNCSIPGQGDLSNCSKLLIYQLPGEHIGIVWKWIGGKQNIYTKHMICQKNIKKQEFNKKKNTKPNN